MSYQHSYDYSLYLEDTVDCLDGEDHHVLKQSYDRLYSPQDNSHISQE